MEKASKVRTFSKIRDLMPAGSALIPEVIITLPPVVYGIARFLLLVMVRGREAAEEILTRDKGLIVSVLVWVGLCVLVLYGGLHLFN